MHAGNEGNGRSENAERKTRRFAWLFEEWVFQVLLVIAVVTVVVDGVLSLGNSGPTII